MDRLGYMKKHQESIKFGETDPDASYAAIMALRPWESAEKTLVHAIGLAIREAFNIGRAGGSLPEADMSVFAKAPKFFDEEPTRTRIPRTPVQEVPQIRRIARVPAQEAEERTSKPRRIART